MFEKAHQHVHAAVMVLPFIADALEKGCEDATHAEQLKHALVKAADYGAALRGLEASRTHKAVIFGKRFASYHAAGLYLARQYRECYADMVNRRRRKCGQRGRTVDLAMLALLVAELHEGMEAELAAAIGMRRWEQKQRAVDAEARAVSKVTGRRLSPDAPPEVKDFADWLDQVIASITTAAREWAAASMCPGDKREERQRKAKRALRGFYRNTARQ